MPKAKETEPNTFALLVAIAAEIVLLVFDENQKQEKYALDVAIELADHLEKKVANYGSWVSGISCSVLFAVFVSDSELF